MAEAVLVADLGFGDAGKGSLVDYLAADRGARVVVRYNGGAQAAHSVVTPDGRQHTFAQIGSATFLPGVRTFLSRYMILNPLNLLAEAEGLAKLGVHDALDRLSIDGSAPIITPFHVAANQLRELGRGDDRHGSCGQGVGETIVDYRAHGALFASHLRNDTVTAAKLDAIRERLREDLGPLIDAYPEEAAVFHDENLIPAAVETYRDFASAVRIVEREYLSRLLAISPTVIFEGAQGVLLDRWFGFWPNTTWSDTTFLNAERLLAEQRFDGQVTKLGVIRAYATRHGAGPLPTEDETLTSEIPDPRNPENRWQGAFRVGYTDLVLFRYALHVVGGVDALAVTCLDHVAARDQWQTCFGYEQGRSGQARLTDFAPISRDIRHADMVKAQSLMTRMLSTVTPVYGLPRRADPAWLLEKLAEVADAPVTIQSWGPTRADKTARRAVRAAY